MTRQQLKDKFGLSNKQCTFFKKSAGYHKQATKELTDGECAKHVQEAKRQSDNGKAKQKVFTRPLDKMGVYKWK